MKNIFLSILTISFVLVSCSDDDASPIISPSNYGTATVDYSGPSTVSDDVGTVGGININLSKAVNNGTAFTVKQIGGTAVKDVDYTVEGITIPPFGTSGEAEIKIINKPFPRTSTTTATFEVSTREFGTEMLNPNSNLPYTFDITIKDANATDGVTIGFQWNPDHAGDLDLTLYYDNGVDPLDNFDYIASADNPEIGESIITNDFPNGTYYVGLDPYEVFTPKIAYNFGISKPNGEVVEFTGTFDTEDLESYTSDESDLLGSTTYRLVKIVKEDSNYTITQL